MKTMQTGLLALAAASTLLAGCATPVGGADYGRYQVRGEQSVRLATVMSVRAVNIDGTRSGLGGFAGAVAGAIAGNSVGRGNGSGLATVAGAVVGGVAGSAIENSASRQTGVEVTVQFDNGKLSAITQGADEAFAVGDRVMVTSGSGVTRVTKVAAGSALAVPPPPVGSAPSHGGGTVPPAGSAPAHGSTATVPPVAEAGSRWFCPEKGYYPDVQTCTAKWLKIAE